MNRHSAEDAMDLRDAQDWERVLSGAGPEVRQAFAQWARSSEQHLKAFLLNNTLGTELARLDFGREIDLERLIAEVTVDESRDARVSSGGPRY